MPCRSPLFSDTFIHTHIIFIMKQSFKLFLTVTAGILVSLAMTAQVTTSGLSGHVSDESGEPLIGAAVIAVHIPSGTQYSAVANPEGRYVISGMRPGGPYSVQISYLGMASLDFKDVTLKLGEPYELNAVMTVSNELDAVVVVSEGSFNSAKTGAGASFSRRAVDMTPTIDRSVYDVVKYTPEASLNKNGGISFAGTNNRYNSFQIDGAVANDAFGLSSTGTNGGQTGANPISLDAIEEIQVVTAPFDVRQSGFTGGAINAITKSGTNTVRGSFYSYFNNQDFIGTTAGPLEQGETREKYDTQLSQTYGFTVGAPVVKDRLFIFAGAEYSKTSSPNVYSPENGTYESVELNEEVILPDGTSLGKYFNEDMAEAMIRHYEENYGVQGTGESFSPHQVTDRSLNAMARIDWNISDAHKLMLRYQFMDAYADQYDSGSYEYTFNNSSYRQSNRTNTLVAELNSRITDEVSNEFRATAVFVRDSRSVAYSGANIYIADNITLNLGTDYSSGANAMHSDTYTITDNVSIFKGNHTVTAGTHNEIFRFYNVFLQGAYGSYGFTSINDFFNNKINQYGYRYADPSLTGGDTRWGATAWAAQFGLYVQDEWKPARNFTLTYGLRADMPMLMNRPTENPEFNASDIAVSSGQYVGTVPKVSVLLSPRAGFRWYMDSARKSLLRGGAGLFTGRVPFVWLLNAYNNTGMEAKSVTVNQPDSSFPLTSDPYKDIIQSGTASAGGRATINTLSEDFKYPQVFRVNLGYEQEFGKGWKFTFDGLYSKTFNNVFFQNLALARTGTVYAVSADAANESNVAPYYSLDKTYQAVVALKNTDKGYSYSLSGKIEKSFSFGLDLMAAYTFGHSWSVNDGLSSVALSSWQYNYSVDTNSPELSHSLFDRPHRLMAVISYTTPVYAGGLRTSVSLTYEGGSGQRYSYTMNESADFNGDGRNGNSLLYIPTSTEVTQMSWSDEGDAALFEQFISSDKYLSSHRGQWSERYAGIGKFEHHFDLHIAQDFYFDRKHGRKLQFVVDFLNISNLFNREWGLYYDGAYYRQVLGVSSLTTDSQGNVTPVYSYIEPQKLSLSDFYSRWRCQLGFRLTF